MPTVLFITTFFYPQPAVGAIRATRLAAELPALGWRPVVVTRYYGHAPSREQLAEQVHPDVRLEYIGYSKEQQPKPGGAEVGSTAASRRASWRAASGGVSRLLVPDVSIASWRSARPWLLDAVQRHQPDILYARSPPLSNLDPGLWLKQQTGLPLVCDFEDPSLIDSRYGIAGLKRLRARAMQAFDARVYRESDLILHAIPLHYRWARRRYPWAADKCRLLLMAGPSELREARLIPIRSQHGRRTIAVVGAMDEEGVCALARVVNALAKQGYDLELRLTGPLPPTCGSEVSGLLGDRAIIRGRVSHQEALREIIGADVLVNLINPARQAAMGLSSKLFEFVLAGRPFIEVRPTRPDRLFIRTIPGAIVLERADEDDLAEAVKRALRTAALPRHIVDKFAGEHTWPTRARALASWLDQLVALAPSVKSEQRTVAEM